CPSPPLLPTIGHCSPCKLAAPPRAATWSASPLTSVVPVGSRRCYGHHAVGDHPCGRCIAGGRPCGCRATGGCPCVWLPLQGTLATSDRPLAGGQAVADHPYRGLCRGQPPLQRAWS
ncbi:hypothetical protein B296_00054272, partial [Ensete ventricosum]